MFGVDISVPTGQDVFDIRRTNLAAEPIPFEDNFFDSVSAFDFIEHIPRQAIYPGEANVRLPFITLMNEVWRVLKNDARFYAVTPTRPSVQAFQDPTHVNVITEATHHYFCGEEPSGRMYDFNGRFEVCRALDLAQEYDLGRIHLAQILSRLALAPLQSRLWSFPVETARRK